MGGVVAYEMAKQLREQGEQVALLALFDSVAPHQNGKNGKGVDDRQLLLMFARDMGVEPGASPHGLEELRKLRTEEQLSYLLDEAKRQGIIASNTNLEQLRRSFEVFRNNVLAVRKYRPRPLPERLILLKAGEELAENGRRSAEAWGRLARGGVAVSMVEGNHYTMMRAPHVRGLAEQLRACLDGRTAKEGGA